METYLIEFFESRDHLIFASKETKLGELCVIINKGDIIFESSSAGNGGIPPYIKTDNVKRRLLLHENEK